MKDLVLVTEYISRIDGKIVQAAQIRIIQVYLQTKKMRLIFKDERFPETITCAEKFRVPAPGDWMVKTEENEIEFKSDLEFSSEFKLF